MDIIDQSRPNSLQPEPYKHKSYPTMRYHPDGRKRVVENVATDEALGSEWRDSPYPPKPAPVPVDHMANASESTLKAVASFGEQVIGLQQKVMALEARQTQIEADSSAMMELLNAVVNQPESGVAPTDDDGSDRPMTPQIKKRK